jgi:hypothetical protein
MLTIVVPEREYFDDNKNEFVHTKEVTLQLEHSLVSLSKWEAKWNKPFLSSNDKTDEEILDYIRCMTVTQNVDKSVYYRLSKENIEKINDYINLPMTATTFSDKNASRNKETITAEIVYYWMIALNIPFECQKWHLNRLLTLVKVCSIKNTPPKKMSRNEIFSRNRALNASRRKALGTKG